MKEFRGGNTNLGEVADKLGLTPKQRTMSRGKLKEWGISLPQTRINYDEVIKSIEDADSNKELREILSRIPARSLRSFLSRRNGSQTTFMSLGNLLKGLGFGFNKDCHLVGKRLRKIGIPVKKLPNVLHKGKEQREYSVSYWVTLCKREEKVKSAIETMFRAGEIRKTNGKQVQPDQPVEVFPAVMQPAGKY